MTTEQLESRLRELHEMAKAVLADVRRWAGDRPLLDLRIRGALVAVTDVVDGCECARLVLTKVLGRRAKAALPD